MSHRQVHHQIGVVVREAARLFLFLFVVSILFLYERFSSLHLTGYSLKIDRNIRRLRKEVRKEQEERMTQEEEQHAQTMRK